MSDASELMERSLRECERAVADYVEREQVENVLLLQRRIVVDAADLLNQATPVDRGPTHNSWITTTDSPSTEDRVVDVAATARAAARRLRPFGVAYITNNRPHIQVLNLGQFEHDTPPGGSRDPRPYRKGRIWVRGGFSVQAPRGIVPIVVEQITAQYVE